VIVSQTLSKSSGAWVKALPALGLGTVITLSLFYLMSQLISGGNALQKQGELDQMIEFVRVKRNSVLNERKRQKPKKPPEAKKPPPLQKMAIAADAPTMPQLKMDRPKLSTALKGNGPYLGQAGAGGGKSGSSTPIVRIEPQYPQKAAMQGLEGFVQLSFDITKTGTVSNVKVLKSQPRRIFDMAAKRALLKWKYKPALEDGKAIAKAGEMVQLDFKLEN